MTQGPRTGGARRVNCARCARPVLRQLVGRLAALDVAADAEPMPAADAAALRTEDRLDWCVRQTAAGPELRWADCRTRRTPCPHPHVIDHACTGPRVPLTPSRPRSRRRPTPVSDGQLTL
ncbi:hypothetical protein [Streptomyces zaomyceticus]|uniref:hypothetical protein n=1 Tax=Streptomyces zaomyceticus TaxID=68286 RepID=UPI002E0FC269|nr:hypothetical protein OG237_15745 [Streptomyces zaomyceticus]